MTGLKRRQVLGGVLSDGSVAVPPPEYDSITYDAITETFGVGFNGPLIMIVGIVESDDPVEVLDGLKAEIEAMPGVKMVAAATPNANPIAPGSATGAVPAPTSRLPQNAPMEEAS